MFRQGLRRCTGLAGRAASTSMLLRSRAVLPVARQGVASARYVAPLKSVAFMARMYSSEAVAPEAENFQSNAAPEELTKFADLAAVGVHSNLLDAIIKDMRYESMTPVQAKTINPALKGTDIVAQAKTGTGKTLAFLLPLLQRMITEDPTLATKKASRTARSDDIRGIIMSPTRELAEQIATEARRLTQFTGLVVQSAVGGTHKGSMLRQTQRQGCHLLVATPGRLNDLLQDPSSGIEAPNLAALVLDEADRMLDVGFEKELNDIIKCLPSPAEKVRQTMLVSATIPDDVIRLARTMVRPDDFEFVQTIPENESLTHDKVPQHLVPVTSWANMFPTLFELIDRETAKANEDRSNPAFKAIVYFNTTAMVELASELGYLRRKSGGMKIPSFSIQSQLSQNQRTRAAEMFRNTRSGVLFSSDVTARGMDFPNVSHVIQMDVPRDRESYIHRLGRTGRQDKDGDGFLLLPPTSVSVARKTLRGLPIEQDKSLESASFDMDSEELPAIHREVQELSQTADKRVLGAAYTSLFGGQGTQREELVEDLNQWATRGWGWAEPPPVSSSWARNQGLLNAGLNIQDRSRRDDSGDDRRGGDRRGGGRGGDRFGGGGDRGGDRGGARRFGGGSRDRPSSDPFSEMGRLARRDEPSSGRSFGGRGGGGGGRGGGGRGRY